MIMCFSLESAEDRRGWKASPQGELDVITVLSFMGLRGGQADRHADNGRTSKARNKVIGQ